MNPKQGLHDTALTAEAEYSINFTEQGNNSFLSLHTLQWKQQLFIGQWSKILWIQCRKFRFICIFTFFKKYFKRGFSCKYEKKQDYMNMSMIFLTVLVYLLIIL